MRNSRAQVKFGETIGVIIIVYIVVVMGFVWYNNINTKNLIEINQNDQRERAFERYHFIMNLDLIHVSQRGYIDPEFDLYSLIAMSIFTQNQEGVDFFESKLGDSKVEVTLFSSVITFDEFLGDSDVDIEDSGNTIVLYNKEPIGYEYETESFSTLIPISDTVTKQTFVGILKVTTFKRLFG